MTHFLQPMKICIAVFNRISKPLRGCCRAFRRAAAPDQELDVAVVDRLLKVLSAGDSPYPSLHHTGLAGSALHFNLSCSYRLNMNCLHLQLPQCCAPLVHLTLVRCHTWHCSSKWAVTQHKRPALLTTSGFGCKPHLVAASCAVLCLAE